LLEEEKPSTAKGVEKGRRDAEKNFILRHVGAGYGRFIPLTDALLHVYSLTGRSDRWHRPSYTLFLFLELA